MLALRCNHHIACDLSASGNFILGNFSAAKRSACHLSSLYHHQEDTYRASAYHMVAVGNTLRTTMHFNLSLCHRSMMRASSKEKAKNGKIL